MVETLYLHTEKGTEFYNTDVATMFRRKGIAHYSTENENIKAGIIESFNQTLREMMSRLIEHGDSNRYFDVLTDLVEGYNNTSHSRHDGVPDKIGDVDDVQRLWLQKFESKTPKMAQTTLKVKEHVCTVGPRKVLARIP